MSSQLHSVIAALYDLVFHHPMATFQDAALKQIGAVIPFDSAVWATGIHEQNVAYSIGLVNQDMGMLMRYGMAYADADLVCARAFAEPGRSFRFEDTVPLEEYRAMPFYTDFGQSIGIEYAMGTAHRDPIAQLDELIILWRADRDQPFTDEERALNQILTHHMIAAWRHRQIVGLTKLPAGNDNLGYEGRVQAIVNTQGTICAIIGNFSGLLSAEMPDWRGPFLPEPLRAMLQTGATTGRLGRLAVEICNDGERYSVALTPLDQTSPALTPAELRVALQFAEGQSHKGIAEALGTSAHTVRNQISAAYRKLGVTTKMELAEVIKHRGLDKLTVTSGTTG